MISKKGIRLLETLLPKIEEIDMIVSRSISPREAELLSGICEKIYGHEE